jgi:8-oxo-dGTP diphosphatase
MTKPWTPPPPGRHVYDYPRPAVTVDCVVLGLDTNDLKVLLVKRGVEPFRGAWALPGGFVTPDESLDAAARRELAEETGIGEVFLEQLYTFGEPGRDPRGRVITVAYYALAKLADFKVEAATDAAAAAWHPLGDLPALAFDHRAIVDTAVARVRGKVRYRPIGFELLPPRFTLTQLQRLYEIILERPLDKRNFRKKILALDLVVETDEVQRGVRHRAARLYRFDRKKYERLAKQGFEMAI